MRPKHLKEAIKFNFKLHRPVIVWSAPGVGKSAIIQQVAKELGRPLIDKRLSLFDPIDLKGFGTVEKNGKGMQTVFAQMAWLKNLPKNAIVFFDEMTLATVAVLNAALQLLLPNGDGERRLDDFILPKDVDIIAASNRVSDRVGAHKMTWQTANRFQHLELTLHLEDWIKHALQEEFAPQVVYYNRFTQGAALFDFDPTREELAFASPRTWEFVSDAVQALPDPAWETELYQGLIGKAKAYEFAGFCKIWNDMPNPKDVLETPDKADVPQDPGTMVALSGALAKLATRKNMDAIVKYAYRLKREFAIVLVRDCESKHGKEISETRAFCEFQAKFTDVLI